MIVLQIDTENCSPQSHKLLSLRQFNKFLLVNSDNLKCIDYG